MVNSCIQSFFEVVYFKIIHGFETSDSNSNMFQSGSSRKTQLMLSKKSFCHYFSMKWGKTNFTTNSYKNDQCSSFPSLTRHKNRVLFNCKHQRKLFKTACQTALLPELLGELKVKLQEKAPFLAAFFGWCVHVWGSCSPSRGCISIHQ